MPRGPTFLQARMRASSRSNFLVADTSHSQIMSVRQPILRRSLLCRRSRCWLSATFWPQYFAFDFTVLLPSMHFRHPCQKQPWTKTATLWDANTMSGLPGSRLSCNRKRSPFAKRKPHPPGAIGSIARKEAGANLRAHLLIASATSTARPCQPGIEPTPRDTERPAQPFRRPDPPVLRNEGELHIDSFAK
jgi:hypothetical protein